MSAPRPLRGNRKRRGASLPAALQDAPGLRLAYVCVQRRDRAPLSVQCVCRRTHRRWPGVLRAQGPPGARRALLLLPRCGEAEGPSSPRLARCHSGGWRRRRGPRPRRPGEEPADHRCRLPKRGPQDAAQTAAHLAAGRGLDRVGEARCADASGRSARGRRAQGISNHREGPGALGVSAGAEARRPRNRQSAISNR